MREGRWEKVYARAAVRCRAGVSGRVIMRKGVTNREERLPRVVRSVGCSSHQWGSRAPSPAAGVGSGVTENWVAVGQGPIRELTQVSTSARKGAGPRPSPGPGRGAQRGARSPNFGGAKLMDGMMARAAWTC